jgi:tetratricopeptide (TPR) repeat protein
MTQSTVFISYSHDSPEHADRVLALADRLRADGIDCALDQYETSPPEGWPKWMDRHIAKSDFVIVICTETYYRRVMDEEEPGKGRGVKWESTLTYQHLYDADAKNIRFVPVLFESGKVEHIPTPLRGATYYYIDTEQGYEDLYRRLTDQPRTVKPELGKLRELPPRERKQDFFAVRVSLAKLPSTSPDLFGRQKELAMLDAAWEDPNINIVSLVAWGGVGKTALVNKHLLQLGEEGYRGAERVYGWSFYSQGAREGGQASADQFIAAALAWFGDPDPTKGSPWDKGERLAELVKRQPTILILDGLEPLQYPSGEMGGRLKDPGLCCLLRALARHNPGLCILTTRLPVDDLKEFVSTSVERIPLEHLSPEAGAAYLAHLGVKGTPQERKQAVGEFEGHALALTLLGSYLAVVYKGDIRQRGKIARLTQDRKHGGHARRVMESYERWFQGQPELDILRLMGLFDRPAEGGAIEALRAEAAIPGLTSELQGLSHEDWQFAVANLRAARLLAGEDPHQPDTLDCHPLVREHFGGKLQEGHPDAWKEAHSRLYEYYQSQAPELPDTIEEMVPLFAAVAHGCQAGRHQEAFSEVYWHRIRRGDKQFCFFKLGAFGAELAALSGFFDSLWGQPVAGLTKGCKAFVQNAAGLRLRALGRLMEAVQPTQAGLEARISQEDWEDGAKVAGNLSELYLNIGDLTQALNYAQKSVDLADRSGNAFERMVDLTALADALHQAGRLREAEAAFRESEEMYKATHPELPLLLYSLQGFKYCDLLLSQGKYREVQNRVGQTLEWAIQDVSLISVALDHLSLGRAHLLQAQQEGNRDPSTGLRTGFSQAAAHLNQAVDGLRQAGLQEFIARGLLARAELRRAMDSLDRARRDLEEALSIATRGGMRLHQADCHLEYARLRLACGEKEKARESLAQAKEMIEDMGYHRRDGEVAELEEIMNQDSGHGRTRTNTE